LRQEGSLCRSQGIEFVSFPIKDYSVPASPREVEHLVREMIPTLRAGRKIAIHCRAGIGRSSVVAACTLIGLGLQPEDALARIGRARGLRVPNSPSLFAQNAISIDPRPISGAALPREFRKKTTELPLEIS
jgi:protein-tyrosine phosphatase